MTNSAEAIDDQVHRLIAAMPSISGADDANLCDRLVQLERVANLAQSEQASVMCELAERAQRADRADRADQEPRGRQLLPPELRTEFVADEIAVTLSCTKAAAARRYGLALSASEHPSVLGAWRRGVIDSRKAQVICDGLAGVSHPAANALADQAAKYATTHTSPEVRRWLQRRVIAADPGMAEIRRAKAVADRMVCVTPLSDGVSELYALLPSVQARQIYDTVNSVAMAAGAGDVRAMDQRRADALVDLLIGRAEPPQVTVQAVVPADTLLGPSAEPADVAGIGPITSSEVIELVGAPDRDIAFRRMLADPDSGYLVDIAEKQYRPSPALDRAIRARDRVCRFPGCSRPATKGQGTDLDHTIPWPRGETTASNLAVLCRHHHLLKHSPGWTTELHPDGVMEWTSPAGRTYRTEPWIYTDTG